MAKLTVLKFKTRYLTHPSFLTHYRCEPAGRSVKDTVLRVLVPNNSAATGVCN